MVTLLTNLAPLRQLTPLEQMFYRVSPIRAGLILMASALVLLLLAFCIVSIIVILKRGQRARCPHCGTTRIRHAWPRFRDRIFLIFSPFRCEACLRRFYLMKPLGQSRQRTAKAAVMR
jgi:hypothetical protein